MGEFARRRGWAALCSTAAAASFAGAAMTASVGEWTLAVLTGVVGATMLGAAIRYYSGW